MASVVHGGGRLRSAVAAVVKQADSDGRPELMAPLAAAVKVLTF